jgi:large subunit ribosomal protein L23
MAKKDPFQVIKHQYITEKTQVLSGLKDAKSNLSVARCVLPKYVFIVDVGATKTEIRHALEEIYKDKQIKVLAVNTINTKSKARRIRGRFGRTAASKKAVVTLAENDVLENV